MRTIKTSFGKQLTQQQETRELATTHCIWLLWYGSFKSTPGSPWFIILGAYSPPTLAQRALFFSSPWRPLPSGYFCQRASCCLSLDGHQLKFKHRALPSELQPQGIWIPAIAVDDREIVPIKSAGFNGARASVDCGVARSPYAKRAIICYGGANQESGSHPDQKTKG